MINNRECKKCEEDTHNDEWAYYNNKICINCEHTYNDYYNACQETWNEQQKTFQEENEISDEDKERANHIAMSQSRGELLMSCEVNTQWFERAYEEHYDKLKAMGLSDQEIDKFINELFYNSND